MKLASVFRGPLAVVAHAHPFQKRAHLVIQAVRILGRAYHRRGLIYQSRGQHNFAIEDFSTAISLSPDSPEPYNGRGVSYLALNDNDTTFYLGRERIIIANGERKPDARRAPDDAGLPRMARWRKKLFVIMSRNARSATEFFGIPPNRVVELGAQVEF